MFRRASLFSFAMLACLVLIARPALAHVGHGEAASWLAGLFHPLSGLDHLVAMIAVGLWAALKGGRALWVWPLAFVSTMIAGAGLALAGFALPFVEPGILASIVALGLLVMLAVDMPVSFGAALMGVFALFHGYAHGAEVPHTASAIAYVAGFSIATLMLHFAGLLFAFGMTRVRLSSLVRAAGLACMVLGLVLSFQAM